MRLNITAKYSLILLFPMLAAIAVLWAFYIFMDQVKADVPYTNIAGRQRMLSEQLHNYAHMVRLGQEEDRKPLNALIDSFSGSLDALQFGGLVVGLNVNLPAAPAEILPTLEALRRIWLPLKKQLRVIATVPVGDVRSQAAYVLVNKQAPKLTQAANEVVNAFGAHTAALHLNMRNLLIANACFTLFLLLLGFRAARRYIAAPVRELNQVTAAIDAGDFSRRAQVDSQDELGSLADSVNSMAASIESSLLLERKSRLRQERLARRVVELGGKHAREAILQHIVEAARKITAARFAVFTCGSDARGQAIASGLTPEEALAFEGFLYQGDGLPCDLCQARKSVNIEDIADYAAKNGMPPQHPPMKRLLGVPILFDEEKFGVLFLADKLDASPFTEEDENTVDMLAMACAIAISNTKNIHELKKTNRRLHSHEVELELMNDELSNANAAKSQFLANTSHELRTPLNAIIGFSDLLGNPRLGDLSEKQRRYVNNIYVSGERLLSIINDLLDISKIEAGMMVVEEVISEPSGIIQDVLHELDSLAVEKQIELSFELEGQEERVHLDAGKLHQMLVNVIGNAIKFTDEQGEVRIDMSMPVANADECRLLIDVTDTGPGIAGKDQEKIFEPFMQAQGGLNRQFGGTGLGLALTRKQINLLGGEISVQSSPGEGSCFTLELPVRQADPVDREGEMQAQPEAASLGASEAFELAPDAGPRPRVLIADTDADRARAVELLMHRQGYETLCSELDQINRMSEQFCPFLIVLGVCADHASLHERLQALKRGREAKNIPVVLVGGKADDLEFSMGPVGMIEKGTNQQALLDLIARHNQYIPTHPSIPTVLVIDDEQSVRELLSEILVAEGYRVLLAGGGEEGIRLAIEREPDLIILDVMMPDISGFDVVTRLNSHPIASHIPVVIYTARDLTREESLHFGHEVERVLIKGSTGRSDLLRQLHKLELLYPARAHLMNPTLGCFNARYIQRRLNQEIANAKRFATQFSLICWQVDDYDAYIKEYGERWGVAALKTMLDTVKIVTRKGDVCAHMDDARFLLFLPKVSSSGAARVAEKMRIRFKHQRHLLPDDEVGMLTASFSSAHYCLDADNADGLLRVLSERVVQAVNAGGDRGEFGES